MICLLIHPKEALVGTIKLFHVSHLFLALQEASLIPLSREACGGRKKKREVQRERATWESVRERDEQEHHRRKSWTPATPVLHRRDSISEVSANFPFFSHFFRAHWTLVEWERETRWFWKGSGSFASLMSFLCIWVRFFKGNF